MNMYEISWKLKG